jgi:hypothetical protein
MRIIAREIIAYSASPRPGEIVSLGIEVQQAIIAVYAERTGSVVIACYNDRNSACREHHPNKREFGRAIRHARLSGALLVMARLGEVCYHTHPSCRPLVRDYKATREKLCNRATIQILALMATNETMPKYGVERELANSTAG